MDPASVIPKSVPPSENFASTPFLAPLFDFLPGRQRWRSTNAPNLAQTLVPGLELSAAQTRLAPQAGLNSWVAARLDLAAAFAQFQSSTNRHRTKSNSPLSSSNEISQAEAAGGVLAAMAPVGPVFQELREASRRAYCRFDIKYDNDDPAAIVLPHLAVLGRLSQLLELRVAAELANGESDQAAEDVHLMLYLANAARDEPIMVSQLVRMRQTRQALQSIAEGMGKWSEPQLRSFQQSLEHFNFCADMQRAMDAERVFFGGGMIDFVHHNPEMYSALAGNGTGRELTFPGALWAGAPGGWFDLEKLRYHQSFDRYRLPGLNLADHLIAPAAIDMAEAGMTRLVTRPWPLLFIRHEVFSALLLPGFSGALRKTAFAQTGVDLGAIACAIERYRLKNGALPESLDRLAQLDVGTGGNHLQAIPRDLINGQPLKYRRENERGYVLYSIGWNAADDGGTNISVKGEHDIPLQGDWVWRPL